MVSYQETGANIQTGDGIQLTLAEERHQVENSLSEDESGSVRDRPRK